MVDKSGCIAVLIMFVLALLVSVLITGVFVAIACWAFGWTFSWKIAIGIYAIVCILSMIFGGTHS